MMPLRERFARLRSHCGFIDRGRSLSGAIRVGALRNEIVLRRLVVSGSRIGTDAGSVDALIGYQIILGVDGPLSGKVLHPGTPVARCPLLLPGFGRFFLGIGVGDDKCLGVWLLFQGERNLVKAGFGFIVDARRTPRVGREADGAKRLSLRRRRRRWRCLNGDVCVGAYRMILVIGDFAGDSDCAGGRSGGREGGCSSGALNAALGCRIAVSERPILRTYRLCGDGRSVSGLDGVRVGGAGDGRRLESFDRKLRGASSRLSGLAALLTLLSFFYLAVNGVIARLQRRCVHRGGGPVPGNTLAAPRVD